MSASTTVTAVTNIRWFRDIRLDDVGLVGGKNASLGELYSVLSEQGVRVPNGFALTADAYRNALTEAGAWERLHRLSTQSIRRG
jgi:pyruvate,water dikinase